MASRRKPPTQALLNRRASLIGASKLWEKLGSQLSKNFPPLPNGFTSQIQFIQWNAMTGNMNLNGTGKVLDPEKVINTVLPFYGLNLTSLQKFPLQNRIVANITNMPLIPEGQKAFVGLTIYYCDGDFWYTIVKQMEQYAEDNNIDFDEVEIGDGCYIAWIGCGVGSIKSSIQGQCNGNFE